VHRIGIREFKSSTSAWLRKVQAGDEMTITDRGEAIVRLTPIAASPDCANLAALRESVRRGEATWSGRKPKARPRGVASRQGGEPISDWVIRNRR